MKGKFICLLLVLALSGCSEGDHSLRNWMEPNGKKKILATTAMITDLAQQVGGEHIEVLTLIVGELDPHSYELVKGDDEKLSFADIVFFNGLGLEHGASLKYALENNSNAVPLGDRVISEDSAYAIYVDGQLDPHLWMDISLWSRIVPYIVESLSALDPAHSSDYKERGDALMQLMSIEHEQIIQTMGQISSEKRFLVTSHDAFNYFTRAYLAEKSEVGAEWENRFASPEGLAPDSQLSVSDIRTIIDHLKTYHITVIFPECNVSKSSLLKIIEAGREEGIDVTIASECLYADSMPKGQTYLEMLRYDATLMQLYWTKNE